MGRPRIIDENGKTVHVGLVVSEPMFKQLKAEAEKRGVSFSAVVREKLAKAS